MDLDCRVHVIFLVLSRRDAAFPQVEQEASTLGTRARNAIKSSVANRMPAIVLNSFFLARFYCDDEGWLSGCRDRVASSHGNQR
jgi:hypothetical protein